MLSVDVIGNIIQPLTKREQEVYDLLLRGLDKKTMAEILCIAPATIGTYVTAVFQKTYVSGQRELMYKRILELEKAVLEMKAGQM